MPSIMFFDTEFNDLDFTRAFIQEIGWAIFDIDTKRLIRSKSELVRWNLHYEVNESAFKTTGLTREFCEKFGRPAREVFTDFLIDLEKVDAHCGHNSLDADIPLILSNINRVLYDRPNLFEQKRGFDTFHDLYNLQSGQSMKLKYLSYDLGFILNNAHEALADVFACAHIFFKHDFMTMHERAATPLVTLTGFTDYWDMTGRELFYSQGFRWDRENKCHTKRCRSYYIPQIQEALGQYNFYCDGKMISVQQEMNLDQAVNSSNEFDEHSEIPF